MAYPEGWDYRDSVSATWPECAGNNSVLNDSAFWIMCGAVVILLGSLLGWQGVSFSAFSEDRTDEELHYSVSAAITRNVSEATGSLAIGREFANLLGVLKEGFDVLTGEGASQDDLDADEAGRYSIY